MKPPIAAIWRPGLPQDTQSSLMNCFEAALADRSRSHPPICFFRADDIGVPGDNCRQLLDLFARHNTPLNLAVVPAWLTTARWEALQKAAGSTPQRWCWHQHGWRHVNHEQSGRKQEFGPVREPHQLRADILAGRRRLEKIMGADAAPFFTPPWNRCSAETLALLRALGYKAVSRNRQARPAPQPSLPDFAVNVDLHTRKEQSASDGWRCLLADIRQALSEKCCGFMIHHQRMNAPAFDFLEHLLTAISGFPDISVHHFNTMTAP